MAHLWNPTLYNTVPQVQVEGHQQPKTLMRERAKLTKPYFNPESQM